MSLIGSLEDLGLGDILQIIHLSQKSGVLSIRGDGGEGCIVFQSGMVRLASLKGDPEDLRGLLVERGFVSESDFEAAASSARETGVELSTALAQHTSVSLERIDSLRRECAERAVGNMFSWTSGEFSFDVGAEDEHLNSEMSLSTGVNAQYMAMESLRIWDEEGHAGKRDSGASAESDADTGTDLNLDLSAEEMFGVSEPAAEVLEAEEHPEDFIEAVELIEEPEPVAEPQLLEPTEPLEEFEFVAPDIGESNAEAAGSVDALVQATTERVAPYEPGADDEQLSPVIVIDASLPVLEWVREALAPYAASVHVFQRSQEGLGRIRQYLARAQAPILLISPEIEGNPLSGIVDAGDYVRRLREQAPRMPIAWLVSEHETPDGLLPVALPTLEHPSRNALQSGGSSEAHETLARRLVATLREESARLSAGSRTGPAAQGAAQSMGDSINDLVSQAEDLREQVAKFQI